jgi:hypothetical protein
MSLIKGDYDLLLIGLGNQYLKVPFLERSNQFYTRIINPDRLIDKFTGKRRIVKTLPFDEKNSDRLFLKPKAWWDF